MSRLILAGSVLRRQPLLHVLVLCASGLLMISLMNPCRLGCSDERLAGLRLALTTGDPAARIEAINQIGKLGARAQTLIPELAGLLDQQGCALMAASALAKMGAPAIEPLAVGSGATEALMRRACAHGLGQMTCQDPRIEESLAALARDPDRPVRQTAVNSLWLRPRLTPVAIKALEQALNDPEPWIRMLARNALNRTDPASPRPAPLSYLPPSN